MASGPKRSKKTASTGGGKGLRRKKQFKERFRSSVLQPLDEETEDDRSGPFLPARLAHLKGPSACLPAPAALLHQHQNQHQHQHQQRQMTKAGDPNPNPGAAAACGSQPMLRGPAGSLLMGPWNGQFARAGSDAAAAAAAAAADDDDDDDFVDPETPPNGLESNTVPAFNRLKRDHDVADDGDTEEGEVNFAVEGDIVREAPPREAYFDECKDELSDLAFTGPDEMQLDHGGVTREQMMEDALTGRASGADADAGLGHHQQAQSASRRSPGRGAAAAVGHVVVAGRRTNSAPAAVTRRVGPARVATRRRISMTVKRQTQERLANMRRETGGGGGGGLFGGGKYGGANVSVRNQGPRNTMGMRCMQPRSNGVM